MQLNLKQAQIATYKSRIIEAMDQQKLYLDNNLSIHSFSNALQIPRQYISEVLNLYMDVSFQDFVNQYRVDAFVDCLQKEQYEHYTLFGIANEVGFNSKSTFNATFKKIKGLTPREFKSEMLQAQLIRPN